MSVAKRARLLPMFLVAVLCGTPASVDAASDASLVAQAPHEVDQVVAARRPANKPARLDGMALLQLAAPATGGALSYSGMAQLEAEAHRGVVSVLLNPRLRVADFSAVKATTSVFFQQAFVRIAMPFGDLKVGKMLAQFGRVWDYGMYGPLLANTDVKLTPDLGIGLEASQSISEAMNIDWAAQFFIADGKALSIHDRTLFSLRNARRRNIAVLRAQPSIEAFGGRVAWGASGQYFDAVYHGKRHIWRMATDVDYSRPGFDAFVEMGQQRGDDLATGNNQWVSSHSYVWAGAQKQLGPVYVRYHANVVRYHAPQRSIEVLHQPGVEYVVQKHVSLVAEGALWSRSPAAPGYGEKSIFFVVMAHP